MQEQNFYTCPNDELDEELTIDLKKIILAIWSRRILIVKVFAIVFIYFVLMTFISAKKYTVDADLYINKANGSNLMDINPYVIEELGGAGGGMAAMMTGGGGLANELELMQSPLVIDKVIQENDLKFGKVYGIIPTVKTGKLMTTDKFLKSKKLSVENKKGTNVVSISYKSKDRELAYNVVSSVITNYIELHKSIHSDKSKSDKKIIETEYNKAKADLEKNMKTVTGIPANAMMQTGHLSAMSAFSSSARKAMTSMNSEFIAGEKSRVAVTEDAAKLAELAKKLEWAKLVDEMSDSSKVLVIKEPRMLQAYEQTSPKLFTNILLGIVFGIIASLGAVIFKETTDKKLAYSMLGDNIIYNAKDDLIDLKSILITSKKEKLSAVIFEGIDNELISELQKYQNINFVKADITDDFANGISESKKVIIIAKIGKTDSKLYKKIKQMLNNMHTNILTEVLV